MTLLVLGMLLGAAAAQPALPMGDAPVQIVEGHLVAVAIGLVPDGESSLVARRLSARSLARERATAMLHAYVDAALRGASVSPRVARDLHSAIDAHLDLRRIRSRADGSAVVELVLPVRVLAEVGCAPLLPWCT